MQLLDGGRSAVLALVPKGIQVWPSVLGPKLHSVNAEHGVL